MSRKPGRPRRRGDSSQKSDGATPSKSRPVQTGPVLTGHTKPEPAIDPACYSTPHPPRKRLPLVLIGGGLLLAWNIFLAAAALLG